MPNEVVTTLKIDDRLTAALDTAVVGITNYGEKSQQQLGKIEEGFRAVGEARGSVGHATGTIKDLQVQTTEAGNALNKFAPATMAVAGGLGILGRAAQTQNAALGEGITKLGATIQTVGAAATSYRGLIEVLGAARASQIALNLVSGPWGWAALAAGAAVSAAAYMAFSRAVAEARQSIQTTDEYLKEHQVTVIKTAEDALKAAETEKQTALAREQAAKEILAAHILELDAAKVRVQAPGVAPGAPIQGGAALGELLAKTRASEAHEEATRRVAEAEKQLAEATRDVAEAEERRAAAQKKSDHEKLLKSLQAETAMMRLQASVAGGSPTEQKRAEHEAAGATAEELAAWDVTAGQLAMAQATQKAKEEAEKQEQVFKQLADQMKLETAMVGQDEAAKARLKIATMDLTAAQKEQLQEQSDHLQLLQEADRREKEAAAQQERMAQTLDARAKQMTEAMRTPLERYKETLAEIKQLEELHREDAGRGITAETAERARKKAGEELSGSGGQNAFHAQVERGDQLYQRIQSAAATPNKPEDRAAKAAEANLAVGRQQVDLLKKIADKNPPAQPSATVKATFGA